MQAVSAAGAPSLAVAGTRVHGFDFLRGVCALAVAAYHLLSWQEIAHLEAWGRYGVYIFFLLSGASMYLAYDHKFQAGYSPLKFIALRFARLTPLFLTVLVLKVAYGIATGRALLDQLGLLFTNATFLFGMGNPAATSVVIGGWSLGIEFLFYLMFPVLCAAVRSKACKAVLVAAFIGQHIFIHQALDGSTLAEAWTRYTQMLSFIFYFVAGCAIGRALRAGKLPPGEWWWALLVVFLIPLASINGEHNLTGPTGIGLSLCAAALVLAAGAVPIAGAGARLADYLGKMSYGVYLIHPFAYMALKNSFPPGQPLLFAALVLALSAGLALVSERFLEAPVMAWAQRKLAPPAAAL